MPPFLTTSSHLFISLTMKAPNSAGDFFTTTAPSLANCFSTSGESCAAVSAAWTLSMIGCGVPAGATMPHQLTAS